MEEESLITAENDSSWSNFEGSYNEYLFDHVKMYGERTYQIDGVTGRCVTFRQLFDNVKCLAASLERLGISSGETISLSSENRLEFSTVLLASLFAGTVFAPINSTYSRDEIVHILGISKPSIIFCSASTLKNITLALPSLKGIRHVVIFDDVAPDSTIPLLKFASLLEVQPIVKPCACKDSDIALILSSSGTTGLPKGVMLSYENLKFVFLFARSKKYMNMCKNSVCLGLLPLYHGYGCSLVLSSALTGAKVVLLPKFEEKLFLSSIQKYKINKLFLVPPLMTFIAKHPMVLQYDLSSVQDIVCGAAPLTRDLIPIILKRLPGVDVRQGYGMTELSIAVTMTTPYSNMPESVGKLAPGLQAKVVDVETKQPLERGQRGELWFKGVCVMAGYCNNPQATQETVDSDGWLHTGDVGFVDDNGYFYIVDRIKELIKYKGYQVAPAELESLLMEISGVSDAAVVGVPDASAGELPVAYIVRQPQATLTKEDIMKHVNGKVSPHKRLRDVRFIEKIPRNLTGKILRRALKNSLAAKL